MNGSLGYLRGFTRCLLCGGEHEPTSVSFGVYGSISVCPGHPMKLKETILTRTKANGKAPRMIADEIIGRAQGK
jgi:hypothetical protein